MKLKVGIFILSIVILGCVVEVKTKISCTSLCISDTT